MSKVRVTAPFPTEQDIEQLLRVPKRRSDELFAELTEARAARGGAPLHGLARSRNSKRVPNATAAHKSLTTKRAAKKK
jgi:hypothetical protein